MRKTVPIFFILFLFVAGFVFGNGAAEDSAESGKLSVFVSVLPQQYFAEKIGGDRIEVDVMVPPGRSPATYEPTPGQVAALSGAEVFFTVGVPFETAFLPKVVGALDSLTVADTSEGIVKRRIDGHAHDEDEHDEHAEADEHEGDDPHIWLSPVLAKKQAENIHRILVELDPSGRVDYDAGLAELNAELDALHTQTADLLAPYEGSTLFIYHPTLGYFADEYGLEQVAIEAGGKQPSAAELSEIIEHAKDDGVKIVFVQPEFSKEAAGVIADAIGGSVVELNPLDPDYIRNISRIAEEIRDSYK